MILANKISTLRKKNGWSQEELAEKMNVSRQSVSKWEGAQSVPDIEKILQLGEMFGVTTDYLLKDEIEDAEYTDTSDDEQKVKRVSLQEANDYLSLRETTSKRIALATFLCILSPICLLILGAASEVPSYNISENLSGAIGLIVLLIIVAIAVMIFISCGSKSTPYEYLEKDLFETEYGVKGMVKERQKAYHDTYTRANMIGTFICILSLVPLFIGSFSEIDFFMIIMLCITILLAGVGVMFFITAGVKWESMKKLLQEGDYTLKHKKSDSIEDKISAIYWLIVVAIFLGWSFYTNDWHVTWIIWPIAGVIFAAIMIVCSIFNSKDK